MRYIVKSVALAIAVSLQALPAAPAFAAGPYTDELSKCLVRSTTTTDKTLLAQWLFAAAALNPAIKSLATVSDGQRTELSKKTARLFEGLLMHACLAEAQQTLKFEGLSAVGASFSALGEVASRELLGHQSAVGGMTEWEKYFDEERVQKALEPSK